MRNTSRVEPLIHTWQQRSAAGDDLVAFVPMRFAQHPPFGKPCHMAEFPARRIDTRVIWDLPLLWREIFEDCPGPVVRVEQRVLELGFFCSSRGHPFG